MFTKPKARLDYDSAPLEKLRNGMEAQHSQQTATEEQIISSAAFVCKILDSLPQATLEEKRQVIETINVHVVYKDAEQSRIFFDLPPKDGQTDKDMDEYRWKGPESLASIQWDNSHATLSRLSARRSSDEPRGPAGR
jgi:hypothetical protein